MRSSRRSSYVFEHSIRPGGGRWAELHAYSDPEHIRRILKQLCKNEHGYAAYHAIWHGATLGIWVVQRGVVTRFIDLHPNITARLGRKPPVAIAERTTLLERLGCDEDEFEAGLPEKIELGLDWDELAAELPELHEPLLAPGEHTRIRHRKRPRFHTYLNEDGVLFGSVDAESGYRIKPPFRIRGWDPLAEYEGDDD